MAEQQKPTGSALPGQDSTPVQRDQGEQIQITTPDQFASTPFNPGQSAGQHNHVTRKLTENPLESRNQTSGLREHVNTLEQDDLASADINPLIDRQTNGRHLTQGGGALSRQSSPNKQSVLVKRVMRDGRVVSGLDSLRGKRNSEPIDEDLGTLGSQNASLGHIGNNTLTRESKAVYATNDANDSRLRSTMYITGKSQRFPIKASNLRVNQAIPGAPSPPQQSMVINLGERTESNFGNMINGQPGPEVDFLVGVSDIVTGAYRIQQQPANLLNQPPAFLNNSGSVVSRSYRSSDYRNSKNGPIMNAAGTQAQESQLQTPMIVDPLELDKQRISAGLDSGGMQIQSLSPSTLKKHTLAEKQNQIQMRNVGNRDSLLIGQNGERINDMSPSGAKNYERQELTGISVTIVDARSMIPSRPNQKLDRSPRLPAKQGQYRNTSKSPAKGPSNDIKRFHKNTAKQYKEYIKKSMQEGERHKFSSRMENHDNSQSTLMDYEYAVAFDRVDNSLELRPGLINQGTQPSEIMMRSLEDQLHQLKNSSGENFYQPNTAGIARAIETRDSPTHHKQAVNQDLRDVRLLDTIRSEASTEKKFDSQHQMSNVPQQTIQTLRRTGGPVESESRSNITNSKMLQTYRGSDNMKLKIIDQSVLRTIGANASTSIMGDQKDMKSSPSKDLRDAGSLADEGTSPKRKSIIFDSTGVIENRYPLNIPGQLMPTQLSPYESSIMQKASPLNRIESFRALLHQESAANELRIISNQDNFRNLINPEVTRKEYTILSTSPSKNTINISNVQNQHILMRKEDDMLHTVTNEFLEENLKASHKSMANPSPARVKKIQMDVKHFKEQLARKIEEIRAMESDKIPYLPQTAEQSSQGSIPYGTIKNMQRLQEGRYSAENIDNTLFMTFLQHTQNSNQQVDFAVDTFSQRKKSLKDKRPYPLSNRQSSELEKQSLELPLLSPQQRGSRRGGTDESSAETKKEVTIDPMANSEKAVKQKKKPFKGEHDLVSFAGQHSRQKKSHATLVSSGGSNKTIKRAVKRYCREHRIAIFEDGCMLHETSPCLIVELNQLLRRHYLQQNGQSSFTTQQQDINAQIVMYMRAVREILDQCGTHLAIESLLTPEEKVELKGAAPKKFNQLYTVYGEPVTNLLKIDEECCILVAGHKTGFKGLKTNKLFEKQESANAMLNRIVDQSPISFDTKSTWQPQLSNTNSGKKLESPFKRQRNNESPGKTFALTQSSAIVDGSNIDPLTSARKNASQPLIKESDGREGKRYQSMNSQDIIKASKVELMKHLTSKQSRSQVQSHAQTLQAKRMESIKLMTSGIKQGKLPPIKTPKQLEVFVFGEKRSGHTSKASTHRNKNAGRVTVEHVVAHQYGPTIVDKTPIHRTMTIAETANEGSIEQDSLSLVQTEMTGHGRRKQTQDNVATNRQYAESIKHDSISSIPPRSSMGVSQDNELEFELSERSKDKKVNLNLRRKLDAVHSIQMIDEDQVASSGTYQTEVKIASKPNARISERNIKIARLAIRERSPSYSNNKLVSQTSQQDESQHAEIKMKLTQRQKDKLKAEANEHVMQNALKQREAWREKYSLDDRQLFTLFSEFSSMMQIHRMQINEEDPESLTNQMKNRNAKTGEDDDKISKLFPMGANISSTKYNILQRGEKHKSHKLKMTDYRDFRVPVQVCIDYSEVLRPTKVRLRAIVMSALGILANYKKAKVTMDEFLRINSFLRFGNCSHDDFIWFCVKLFDPQMCGFTRIQDCEEVIDLLFDNQDEDGKTTKAPEVKLPPKQAQKQNQDADKSSVADNNTQSAADAQTRDDQASQANKESAQNKDEQEEREDMGTAGAKTEKSAAETVANASVAKESIASGAQPSQVSKGPVLGADAEGKDESVCANIKKVCYEKGIFKADGFLDPNLLYQAFKDGHLDIDDFKSALK